MTNYGKKNIVAGLLFMGGFMLYGFVLIYLRDFAPGKEEWIANSNIGTHFEARLAHVHGNLFALLNIMIGYLLLKLPIDARSAKWISWAGLLGMAMPLGIMAEFLFGLPFYLVIVGAISIIVAIVWLGLAVAKAPINSSNNQ